MAAKIAALLQELEAELQRVREAIASAPAGDPRAAVAAERLRELEESQRRVEAGQLDPHTLHCCVNDHLNLAVQLAAWVRREAAPDYPSRPLVTKRRPTPQAAASKTVRRRPVCTSRPRERRERRTSRATRGSPSRDDPDEPEPPHVARRRPCVGGAR